MKVLKKSKNETFEDIYTDNYEFRLCGGSVEPSDRKEAAVASKGSESGAK